MLTCVQLTPQDLKLGVAEALNALLEPIRQEFAASPKFQEAFELAYPKPGKKAKRVKDKGSKYPGAPNNPGVAKNTQQVAHMHAEGEVAQDGIANGTEGDLAVGMVGKGVADTPQ